MKKKIALIGGSGFIGSALVRLLGNSTDIINYDIHPSAEKECKTVFADVRDKQALLKKIVPADWVILLAAEHRDDVTPKSLYYDVNVTGALNVLSAMEAKGICNLLFVSSVSVYGLNSYNANEETIPLPSSDYGKSKWQAEQIIKQWQSEYSNRRNAIVVRPTVIFGPGNRGNVYQLLQQVQSGNFVMVGNGNNKKSMAYIENVVHFFSFIINSEFTGYQVFNYTDKPDFKMNRLINFIKLELNQSASRVRIPYFLGYVGGLFLDAVAKLTNKKFSVSSVRIKKWCATTQFSAERMLQTGYQPCYTLEEGLSKTIAGMLHAEVRRKDIVLP